MGEKFEVRIIGKDEASDVFRGVGNVASGIFKVGLGVAAAGTAALAGATLFAIDAAMNEQNVQAQLAAVLESTGGKAGVTADMANGLANELSGLTAFSNEAILAGENMLLTFTNIGADVFPMATETMLDMSQAMGTDATQTAIQLGKALNDPITGISALSRVGVTFTEEQKEMIAAMVEAGDVAGAQTLILEELATEFGGSAEAAGQTFAGQLSIAKDAISDTAEAVGLGLLPGLTALLQDVFIPLTPVIQEVAGHIGTMLGALLEGGPSSEAFQTALTNLFGEEMAGKITNVLTKIVEIKDAIVGFIQTTVVPFVQEHAEAFKGAFIAIGAVLAGAAVLGAIIAIGGVIASLANPITLIIGAVALLGAAWAEDWGGIRTTLTEFWVSTAQPALSQLADWLKVQIPIAIDALKTFWDTKLIPAFEILREWLATNLPIAIDALKAFWTDVLLPAITDVWSFIQNDLLPLFQAVSEFISATFNLALEALAGIWQNVLQPAIEDVYGWINDNLLPVFREISDFLSATFSPVLDGIASIFQTVSDRVGGLSGIIQTVIGWFEKLTTAISEIELPDWMTPGSPMPLETAFWGLGKAIENVASIQFPRLQVASNTLPQEINLTGVGQRVASSPIQTFNVQMQSMQTTESLLDDLFAYAASIGGLST